MHVNAKLKIMKKIQQDFNRDFFEKNSWIKNNIICGIDEVGRGPLFGPIVIGCVILPSFTDTKDLIDSKLLSEKKIIQIAQWIKTNCIFETIAIDPWIIDSFGINKATELAIRRVLYNISNKVIKKISLVLIDKVQIDIKRICNFEIISEPKGEHWSSSIAAASIIAKYTRDKMMASISNIFPKYKLEKNKGYGTKIHIANILEYNISLLHRKLFCRNFNEQRKTIFQKHVHWRSY